MCHTTEVISHGFFKEEHHMMKDFMKHGWFWSHCWLFLKRFQYFLETDRFWSVDQKMLVPQAFIDKIFKNSIYDTEQDQISWSVGQCILIWLLYTDYYYILFFLHVIIIIFQYCAYEASLSLVCYVVHVLSPGPMLHSTTPKILLKTFEVMM